MRVRRIAPEIWVGMSGVWQTTHVICGAHHALIVDSPVTPDELGQLAAQVTARDLVATHADWDHLLAPIAFPHATRHAGDATRARLAREEARVAGELAAWDAARGLPERALPDWRSARSVAAPAVIDSPVGPIDVIPAGGHTCDGIALLVRRDAVLIAGDYLSPCEIPALAADVGPAPYLATLTRLAPVLERARWVVPGHGWPLSRARARAILREDHAYLRALARGGDPPLPRAAGNPVQRAQHVANRAACAAGQPPEA